jgi:hypothetical protein
MTLARQIAYFVAIKEFGEPETETRTFFIIV